MDPLLIILFVILFLLSAFFSGTELALMSLPEHKVDSLVKQKKYGAKSLKKIKTNNDRLLITILIGNNLVNVYTAALATTIAITLGQASGLPQAQTIGIATGIVTFLLLLFGEIIPKSFATKNATNISLLVAPIYKILILILYPIIIFMELLIKLFSKKGKVEQMTEEEIESFIDMGRDSGTLEKQEHEKIKNILEFDETYVDEIMTPRVQIEALSSNTMVKDALDFYLNHTHSRIPVYVKTIDKIDFYITGRELLLEVKDGNLDKKISELELNQVMKVPLNQSIATLLDIFQKAHKVMAIVIDEYGGVSGLITMEDVVEEVFGEIRDETDKEVDEIKKTGNGTFVVESDVLIEDVLEKVGLELNDIGLHEKKFDGETLSYVITHEIERFPESGEIISFNVKSHAENDENVEEYKVDFKVIDIKNHKIGKIEVKKELV